MNNLTSNLLPIKIKPANQTNRLPPSSIQSFLLERPDLASLLITDHDTEFTNAYYNSLYDDNTNIGYNISDSGDNELVQTIQTIASGLAKAIYVQALGEDYVGPELHSEHIRELLNCYLVTANCNIYKAVSLRDHISEKPLGLYVGVTASSNLQTGLTARSLAWLTSTVTELPREQCRSDPLDPVYQYFWMGTNLDDPLNETACFRTTMNYSLAVSPIWELGTQYEWKSGKYSSWTESVWKELGARMYVRPSQRHELVTLGTGTLALALSLALTHAINKRSHILFPRPAQADSATPPVVI